MNSTRLLTAFILVFFFAHNLWANEDEILRDYIPSGRITHFADPVQIWIGGTDYLEGQYYVEAVVEELRRIIPGLDISWTTSKAQSNLRIYLTDSDEEWRQSITASSDGQAKWQEQGQYIRGVTRVLSNSDGCVKRADIILHLDFQTSGGQKLWVVRHEFMHALGVLGHPTQTTDTVLNSHQPQEDKNGCFSDADKIVLRALYSGN